MKVCSKVQSQSVFRWGTPFYMSLFLSVRPSICPSVAHHISGTASCDYNFWYAYVKWWCLQVFFHFFKILIFWVRAKNNPKWQKILSCYISQEPYIIWWWKGKKWPQKVVCLLHLIFQESYIIWSSFMVQMCKRMISPGILFVFSKFWFSRSLGR